MMSTTIKDISKACGLSPATISKYLNGKSISAENAELISRTIHEMDYVPNRHAQILRSRRGKTIALILSKLKEYFWGPALNGIENYSANRGISTMLVRFDPSKRDQTELANFLSSIPVSGCIFLDESIADTNLLGILDTREISYVFMDSCSSDLASDHVTSSNFDGVYQATHYLIQKGHCTFGVISGPRDRYTTQERVNGFLSACREAHIPPKNIQIFYGTYDVTSGADMFCKLMNSRFRPSVVFSLNFHYMISITQQLDAYQLQVPRDLSLITFDDSQLFTACNPPITVIRQNLHRLGEETARLLFRRIKGDREDYPTQIIVPTDFIERASVGPPRGNS